MFYLIEFFKIVFKFPVRGIVYFGFTFLVTLLIQQKDLIQEKINEHYDSFQNLPSFYSLFIGDTNVDMVRRKLLSLPGISRVSLINEGEIKDKVSQVVENLDVDVPGVFFDKSYGALHVILDKNTNINSQNLIREYIQRLVGKDSVIMTPIKLKKDKSEPNQLGKMMKEWGAVILINIAICLWIFSAYIFFGPLKKISFLIEHFQRKSFVQFKLVLTSLLLIFSISSLTSIFLKSLPAIETLFIFFSIILISLPNLKFKYGNR